MTERKSSNRLQWEVDWSHQQNTGSYVWARNPAGHTPRSREWHRTSTGYLRASGVNTPTYRRDSWEVDWTKREGKRVWARNPESKMAETRQWHFVDFKTLKVAGVAWRPKREKPGRYMDSNGYVHLTPRGMTAEEVAIADKNNLWSGKWRSHVRAHQLVAVMAYGPIPPGSVVRHLNGDKTDNRPENLVFGTTKENCRDHETARREAMYWRNRCERSEAALDALLRATPDLVARGEAARNAEQALSLRRSA